MLVKKSGIFGLVFFVWSPTLYLIVSPLLENKNKIKNDRKLTRCKGTFDESGRLHICQTWFNEKRNWNSSQVKSSSLHWYHQHTGSWQLAVQHIATFYQMFVWSRTNKELDTELCLFVCLILGPWETVILLKLTLAHGTTASSRQSNTKLHSTTCLSDQCLSDQCLYDQCLSDQCLSDQCLSDQCLSKQCLSD